MYVCIKLLHNCCEILSELCNYTIEQANDTFHSIKKLINFFLILYIFQRY